MRSAESKILDLGALLARHGRPRAGTLVFTNGCFDLLHAGHVAYLEAARALGDALVVGVNSDASVARLKGPTRPLVSEDARLRVLASLESVDAVCLFDDDTPAALIEAVLPDILVKGGDYTPDRIVGREAVEGAGGRVEVIPFLPGHSTTGIVDRIKAQSHDPSS